MFRQRILLGAAIAAILGLTMPWLQAEPLTLTPGKTVLVVAKNARLIEQDSAKLLQTWLRKAAGITTGFDLKTDADTEALKDKIAVAVGPTALTKTDSRVSQLHDDGFLIHEEGAVISIEGRTGDGTYYGVIAFLDRAAGVRFYMPTDFWASLPTNHTITFDGADYLSQPFVTSGFISGLATKNLGDEDWLRRIGGSRRKGGTHQHDLALIFPIEKFATTHPEIYPIYDDQRYIPKDANDQTWQADFTEPATLEAAEESIDAYFKQTPGSAYIALSINDNNRWSQSPHNEEIIAAFKKKNPEGNYILEATSDIYWRFMNQVAAWMQQKLPGKMLIGLAYGPTSAVPSFPLADNIVVFTNLHLSELPAYTNLQNGQPAILDQWLAIAPHYANHEWYEGDGFLLPRIYSGYWSQFLQKVASHMTSAYMHAEGYPNWGFDGPKYYVMARLWWDPHADPGSLTEQFCNDMFGPAAPAMNTYFQRLDALWEQLDVIDGPKRKIGAWNTQFSSTPASRAIILRCHNLLEAAAAAAQTNEQKKRVALFAKCFAFSESLFDLAEKPTDEDRYNKAVALAKDLSADKWAVYNPDSPLKAIAAIYKGPVKK